MFADCFNNFCTPLHYENLKACPNNAQCLDNLQPFQEVEAPAESPSKAQEMMGYVSQPPSLCALVLQPFHFYFS